MVNTWDSSLLFSIAEKVLSRGLFILLSIGKSNCMTCSMCIITISHVFVEKILNMFLDIYGNALGKNVSNSKC